VSANYEFQLLAKVIEEGDLRTVIEEGLTTDSFGSAEARMVFDFLLNYYQGVKTRNLVPDMELVETHHPTIELPLANSRMTITALCQEVRDEHMRRRMEDVMHVAFESMEDNPAEALSQLSQECKTLQTATELSRDVDLAESAGDMRREYLLARDSTGYLGIPYPVGWGYHTKEGKPKMLKKAGRQHHPLNEQTRGMQDGEFILIYGRPKSMKTWLITDMIKECYWNLNCRVLVFSKEMTPQQLRTRMVARILGVDYMEFRNGMLPPDEEEEFFDLVEHIKDEEERLKLAVKSRGCRFTMGWKSGTVQSGLQSLQTKIEEFEPDIVFADAVYLMKVLKSGAGAMWQDMAEIAYGLKDMASCFNIPIVATSQANREGEKTKGSTMAEIAYGDTFAQACDLAARIIKTENDDGGVFLSVILSGAREIKLPGFRLEVEPARKFLLDQVFDSQRQIQAQFRAEEEAIAHEEEQAAKKVQRTRRLSHLRTNQEHPDRGDGVE